MSGPEPHRAEAFGHLLAALDEARELLEEFSRPGKQIASPGQNPAGLLQQCLDLCAQTAAVGPEPVRMLHHFACTGGTLICKCLSAMPNTQLVGEMDPLSTMQADGALLFAPTDLILLMRQSSRGVSDALITEMFNANLALIEADCRVNGQRLLLRDHAHSHYCHGDRIPDRPSLREIVTARFPVAAALTVRHPLDSYLSLTSLGWVSFGPPGIDEYCRRYLKFLDAHVDIPIVHYEDFVEAPQQQMRVLCGYLHLPYVEDFVDLFDAFQLSGDSGRAGNTIGKRPRRPFGDALAVELDRSPHYERLLQRLQYEN